jgi:PDZ domain-containing protein
LALAGLGLLALTVVILWQVKSNDYIVTPDIAHPVAPIVDVQGGHDPRGPGALYFVDVHVDRASLFEKLFPWIHDGGSLEPIPAGVSDTQEQHIAQQQMVTSQQVAATVALRQLGYKVTAKPTGVQVDALVRGTDAVGKLQQTDLIVSIDGTKVRTLGELHAALAKHRVGEVVAVGVRRSRLTTVHIKLTRRQVGKPQPLLGIVPSQAAQIKLPFRVKIDAGNIGGPSAGLPFALEVAAELGRNVTRGHRVAATGELGADGRVFPIGGVKQKTLGARMAGADIFLVPAGENAQTARRYAKGLRIIPVRNFPQALRALATLPNKG